jgi:hypothetical protein
MFETTKQIYIYIIYISHMIFPLYPNNPIHHKFTPIFTQFTPLSLGVFGATHHDLQHQLTCPTGPLE